MVGSVLVQVLRFGRTLAYGGVSPGPGVEVWEDLGIWWGQGVEVWEDSGGGSSLSPVSLSTRENSQQSESSTSKTL